MDFLVIGYGNTLRSDDGVGQVVANKIAQWQLPGVRSLAVHQLTPELAENMAKVDTVIFVDAAATNLEKPASVRIQKLQAEENTSFGHSCNPRALVAFTQILYNKVIEAYWVLVPAVNFDFGEEFSCLTRREINITLNQIKQLIVRANT